MPDGSVYWDTDKEVWVYRASGLGSCLRALVAARRGVEPRSHDGESLQIMQEGVLHEDAILRRLEAEGITLLGRGQTQVELPIPGTNAVVRGHIDEETADSVVEVKARSRSAYYRWQRQGFDGFPEMAWQVSFYGAALHKPVLLVTKNRDSGELFKVTVHELPHSLNDIISRVLLVENLATATEDYPACDRDGFMCRFYFLHDDYTEKPEKEYSEGSYRLKSVIKKLQDAKEDLKIAEAEVAGLRDMAMELLHGETAVDAGTYKVEVRTVERRRLDTQKLRKELGKKKLDEYYITEDSEQLIVQAS